MEQTQFSQLMNDFKGQLAAQNKIKDLSIFAGNANLPIVVMVHGIGGTAQHWSNPAGVNIEETWLFNISGRPAYQNDKVVPSPTYQPNQVTSWCQFLTTNNISWVNFTQSDNQGPLQTAVNELILILNTLEAQVFQPYAQQVNTDGSGQVPSLILLCHSRGGLVTRSALKQMGKGNLPHLRKVITLHTPHAGSYMPQLSDDYDKFLATKLDFKAVGNKLPKLVSSIFTSVIGNYISQVDDWVCKALKSSFGTMPNGVGFDELIPNSQMLKDLAQGEQPFPGVEYHGFGGSNPIFLNLYLCILDQTLSLLEVVNTELLGMLGAIPEVHSRYGGLAELDKGDSAVSITSSQWPSAFNATHQLFPINHMQALLDPNLQKAVLPLLQN